MSAATGQPPSEWGRRTDLALHDLPALLTEAHATRGTKPITDGTHTRPTPGSRPPDPAELTLLAVHQTIQAAAARVFDEQAAAGLTPAVQPDVITWLASTRPWWEPCWWAPDHVTAPLWQARADLRRLLSIDDELTISCPQCGDTMRDPYDAGQELECPAGHTIPGPARIEALYRRMPPKDPGWLHEHLHVRPGTLRVWRHRDKLAPAWPQGPAEYYPWDVLRLMYPALIEAIESGDTAA